MATAIFMAIIGALFATQLVNPFYIKRFFTYIDMYLKEELPNDKDKENTLRWEKFAKLQVSDTFDFMINQVATFLSVAFILFVWYAMFAAERTFATFLTTLWLPAIGLFISEIAFDESDTYSMKNQEIIFKHTGKVFVAMIAISIITMLSSPFYNIINSRTENFNENFPKSQSWEIDIDEILDKIGFDDEKSYLGEFIYNEGDIIVPIYKGYVISSYVRIYEDGTYRFAENLNICYYADNVDLSSDKAIYKARNAMPSAVFFGKFTYQISPNGKVYSACLYGDHIFLKAGKNIKGVVLVDAESGKVSTISFNEIPSWIHIDC